MMSSEDYQIKSKDFDGSISAAWRKIRNESDFYDVTLACDDSQVDAHKVILSACSPVFSKLLKRNPHQHPLIYLRGMKYSHIVAILDFVYQGEVGVAQEELNDFLAVSKELRVVGLFDEVKEEKDLEKIPKEITSSPKRKKRKRPLDDSEKIDGEELLGDKEDTIEKVVKVETTDFVSMKELEYADNDGQTDEMIEPIADQSTTVVNREKGLEDMTTALVPFQYINTRSPALSDEKESKTQSSLSLKQIVNDVNQELTQAAEATTFENSIEHVKDFSNIATAVVPFENIKTAKTESRSTISKNAPLPIFSKSAPLTTISENSHLPTIPKNIPLPTIPRNAHLPTIPKSASLTTISENSHLPTIPKNAPLPNIRKNEPLQNEPLSLRERVANERKSRKNYRTNEYGNLKTVKSDKSQNKNSLYLKKFATDMKEDKIEKFVGKPVAKIQHPPQQSKPRSENTGGLQISCDQCDYAAPASVYMRTHLVCNSN